MYVCLGPFEGCRILIPTCHKSFDCFDQHADAGEVSALQGAPAQDAKPAFNLIEPAAVGGNKVKMHMGWALSQRSSFGLWVLRLSRTTCSSLPGYMATNSFLKSRNSRLRRRR